MAPPWIVAACLALPGLNEPARKDREKENVPDIECLKLFGNRFRLAVPAVIVTKADSSSRKSIGAVKNEHSGSLVRPSTELER
jgi:hypothetical protein